MDGNTSVTPFAFDTYTTDDWSAQLGQRGTGDDTDSVAGTVTNNTDNGRREYVLVYNDSGATLPASCGLKFSSTFFGTKVVKCTTGLPVRGFVPPTINGSASNTIAIGAYFWMIKEGFASVLKSTANVAEGDFLDASATAGQVKTNVTTNVGLVTVLCGSSLVTNTAGTAIPVRAYINCHW